MQYIAQYLKNSGTPIGLITLLSESYIALPICTKVVIEIAYNNGHMGNFHDLLIGVFNNLILKNYQPDIADNFIQVNPVRLIITRKELPLIG